METEAGVRHGHVRRRVCSGEANPLVLLSREDDMEYQDVGQEHLRGLDLLRGLDHLRDLDHLGHLDHLRGLDHLSDLDIVGACLSSLDCCHTTWIKTTYIISQSGGQKSKVR